MACFNCKYWDRIRASNKNGQIRKGFVVQCLFPITIPDDAPAAMKMVAMNWDDGEGCIQWKQFEGNIEFFSWDE